MAYVVVMVFPWQVVLLGFIIAAIYVCRRGQLQAVVDIGFDSGKGAEDAESMSASAVVDTAKGAVQEVGTHAELLADNQTYREIVDSQLTAEDVA